MNEVSNTQESMLDLETGSDIHSLYRMSSDLRTAFDEIIEGERAGESKRIEANHELAMLIAEALVLRLKHYKPVMASTNERLERLLKELSELVECKRVASDRAWRIHGETEDEDAKGNEYENAIDAQLDYNKAKSMQEWVITTLA